MSLRRPPSPSTADPIPVEYNPHANLRSLKRWVRGKVWRSPALYRRIFEYRNHGRNQFKNTGSFWVAGFQRSGNTFAGVLIDEVLFPDRVDFHLHGPNSLRICAESGKPGFLVIRKPLEAAISLSIFHQWPLLQALEDYIDLHRFWLRDAPGVPVASFEWFTHHPAELITAAARLADLTLPGSPVTQELLEKVQDRIDGLFTRPDGILDEAQVARPSSFRSGLHNKIEAAARTSTVIQERLATAEALRQQFLNRSLEHRHGSEAMQFEESAFRRTR